MAKAKYFVGQIYESINGPVKVLEIIQKDLSKGISNKRAVIRFVNTGYTCNIQLSNLPLGKVKDKRLPSVYGHGYLDTDIRIPQRDSCSVIRRLYDLWANMLKRVYCEKTGASIDKRWLSFNNFLSTVHMVDGYEAWERGDNVHLDKDLLSGESKIYGLDTCKFISACDNIRESALRRWHKK